MKLLFYTVLATFLLGLTYMPAEAGHGHPACPGLETADQVYAHVVEWRIDSYGVLYIPVRDLSGSIVEGISLKQYIAGHLPSKAKILCIDRHFNVSYSHSSEISFRHFIIYFILQ